MSEKDSSFVDKLKNNKIITTTIAIAAVATAGFFGTGANEKYFGTPLPTEIKEEYKLSEADLPKGKEEIAFATEYHDRYGTDAVAMYEYNEAYKKEHNGLPVVYSDKDFEEMRLILLTNVNGNSENEVRERLGFSVMHSEKFEKTTDYFINAFNNHFVPQIERYMALISANPSETELITEYFLSAVYPHEGMSADDEFKTYFDKIARLAQQTVRNADEPDAEFTLVPLSQSTEARSDPFASYAEKTPNQDNYRSVGEETYFNTTIASSFMGFNRVVFLTEMHKHTTATIISRGGLNVLGPIDKDGYGMVTVLLEIGKNTQIEQFTKETK
jgi:hypothetical protein